MRNGVKIAICQVLQGNAFNVAERLDGSGGGIGRNVIYQQSKVAGAEAADHIGVSEQLAVKAVAFQLPAFGYCYFVDVLLREVILILQVVLHQSGEVPFIAGVKVPHDHADHHAALVVGDIAYGAHDKTCANGYVTFFVAAVGIEQLLNFTIWQQMATIFIIYREPPV